MFDLGINADDYADGEVVYHDPITGMRVTKYRIDDNTYALKREFPLTQQFLDACADDRAASSGTRWGDGKIVGRIPMHLLHDENLGLGDALRAGDTSYLGRFLEENPKLKTRDRI
jgi:hypothetical protein